MFSRLPTLDPLDDYINPNRHVVSFDDGEALEAALDRVVAQHSVSAPATKHEE